MRLLYLFKRKESLKKSFYKQLKNSWDIDKKEAKNTLNKHNLYFKPYSEEHFNVLYKLVKNKILKMSH